MLAVLTDIDILQAAPVAVAGSLKTYIVPVPTGNGILGLDNLDIGD